MWIIPNISSVVCLDLSEMEAGKHIADVSKYIEVFLAVF